MKIKKKIAFLLMLVLSLVIAVGVFAACGPTEPVEPGPGDTTTPTDPTDPDDQGGGGQPGSGTQTPTDKEVDSIEVKTQPTKTNYVVGETLDLTGGVLLVTYTDDSTGDVLMTDPGVTFTAPNMNTPGPKTITLNYGGERVRLTGITVSTASYSIVFDVNFEGGTDITTTVNDGSLLTKPADPERSGYTLYAWYTDADYTTAYDFAAPVTSDLTLYAFWKKDGATYVDFTFDYNYYGKKLTEYTIPAESGVPMTEPSDPSRDGYEFVGWYSDEACTTAFDFTANVTAADTAYAKWNKTDTDVSTFTFEAEDTDLSGKSGPSWSGEATERSMIQYVEGIGASGNRFVGYQYREGCTLEFYVASDVAVDDATLFLSVGSEIGDFSLTSSQYQVIVNGTPLNYAAISLESEGLNKKGNFKTVELGNISLNAGANTIQLKTNNTATFQGATYAAYAPMVDCIKIESDAIVYWDEVKGLPADNY